MVAPKTKFMWRRKEVQAPRVVSSRAGQEGGCGVEGKQGLKTASRHDAIVHIPPPFQADPHALGTTLLEGGRMIWARRRRCSLISGLHQHNCNFIYVFAIFNKCSVWACPTQLGRPIKWGAPTPSYKELGACIRVLAFSFRLKTVFRL